MSVILSYDTGYNVAYAIVDTTQRKILDVGGIDIGEKLSMEEFCDKTIYELGNLHYGLSAQKLIRKVNKILIELPKSYGSLKSQTSLKTGKLFYTFASAISLFNYFNDYLSDIEFRTPNEWKGQMTKKTTEKRIKLIYKDFDFDKRKLTDHEFDAIGIATSYDSDLWNLKKGF